MLRALGWLFRWSCLIVLVCFSAALVRVALQSFRDPDAWRRVFASGMLWSAAGGLGLRLGLTRWRKGDPLEFLDTLEHELTHAAVGTATFAPPVSLKATLRKGGEVELQRTNPTAALAPYFLPLYAALGSLLIAWLRPGPQYFGRLAVGFLLGSFAYRLTREFHLGQTDFKEYGLIFSFVFIAASLPLALAAILHWSGMLHLPWTSGVWPAFLEQLQSGWRWLWHFSSPGG